VTDPSGLSDDELVESWAVVTQGFQHTQNLLGLDVDAVLGLAPSWFEVLLRLLRASEHRMPMNRIADDVTMTSGGFTKLADRMVEAGLLRRTPSTNDRRVTYLELTDEGARVAERAMAEHVSSLRARVLAALSEEGIVSLAKTMRDLRNANSAYHQRLADEQ
jgi:DNA-binding MarR family transcriptional regulator